MSADADLLKEGYERGYLAAMKRYDVLATLVAIPKLHEELDAARRRIAELEAEVKDLESVIEEIR